jgi:hypothetical protein
MTRFPLTLAQIADHPVVHGLHRILLIAMVVVEGGLFAYMHSVAYAEFSAWLPAALILGPMLAILSLLRIRVAEGLSVLSLVVVGIGFIVSMLVPALVRN